MDRLAQWNGVHSLGTWNMFPPVIEVSREYRLVIQQSPVEKVQSSMLVFRRGRQLSHIIRKVPLGKFHLGPCV
jgi:hypothetical protein